MAVHAATSASTARPLRMMALRPRIFREAFSIPRDTTGTRLLLRLPIHSVTIGTSVEPHRRADMGHGLGARSPTQVATAKTSKPSSISTRSRNKTATPTTLQYPTSGSVIQSVENLAESNYNAHRGGFPNAAVKASPSMPAMYSRRDISTPPAPLPSRLCRSRWQLRH